MKYSVAALAFAAAAVSAQSLSDIPQCASSCINDARTQNTDCAADDYKCICSNIQVLSTAATSCVLSACGQDVAINQVLPAVQQFCDAVNNGDVPAPAPTSESTSEATSEATSVPTSESAVESTSEPTATQTEEPTEVPSSSSGASAPRTTVTPTFGGSNATATAPVTSLVPSAGAAIAGSIGGFAMVALGALAAF
ncbi:hypothetical protein ANO14919_078290 [Xylariales sp. No.14919]|nr:hypothetical protein ANO14919_078290 [Xylariales sp. No.14919]